MSIRTFLKPLSFIPAILLMYMIFSFSSQDGVTSSQLSYKVSYEIVEIGGKVLDADLTPSEIDRLATRFEGVVRKLAHMTEYFALAVSVAFPLYVYGLRGILLMLVAGVFCVGFACTDEYHQAFVAGRNPARRDVLIDSFGVFWGILLARIIGWTGRRTFSRPLLNKKKKNSERGGRTTDMERDQRQTQASQPYPGTEYANQQYQRYPSQEQPYQQYPTQRQPSWQGQPQSRPFRQSQSQQQPSSWQEQPQSQQDYRYQQNLSWGQQDYRYRQYPQQEQSCRQYSPQEQQGQPYQQHPYRGQQYENVSYYPPRTGQGTPYYEQQYRQVNTPQQYRYGQAQQNYYRQPYPPYGTQPPEMEEETSTSDRLSEDMSLKKLVHDLKEQKKEQKREQKKNAW